MVHRFVDKKRGLGVNVNEELAEETSNWNAQRRKVCAKFKNSIWAEHLQEMGSLSSKSKNIRYFL